MIRLALTSDLHIEHHPEVVDLIAARLRALRPDVAIVAGDVSHDPEGLAAALEKLAGAVPRLAYVPGNHDLWCPATGPSSRDRYEVILPSLVRRAGAHPLTEGALEVGGVTLVGEMGWFDFTLRNRALDDVFPMESYRANAWGLLRWMDKRHVRFEADEGGLFDDEGLCRWMVARLERKLAEVRGPTVVVTHHLAFQELAMMRGEAPWDFLNGFIGSARLGEVIGGCREVTVALAGHTHLKRSALVRGAGGPIACEVSPVGYPREYKRAGLDLAARVAERVLLLELDGAGRVVARDSSNLTAHDPAG